MTIQERLEVVKKNYKKIKVKGKYSTQSKIYQELGLPKESSSNRQNKKVVDMVFTIESTGNPKAPREVIVKSKRRDKTIENLYVEDGRIVNGGSRNNKYEAIMRNALAFGLKPKGGLSHYEPVTRSFIYSDMYGFEKDLLKYEDKTDNEIKYLMELRGKLAASTGLAMNNLKPDILKDWKEVYMVLTSDESNIPGKIEEDTLLIDFLNNSSVFWDAKTMDEANLRRKLNAVLPKGYSADTLTVGEFIFVTGKASKDMNNEVFDFLKDTYWDGQYEEHAEAKQATDRQSKVIDEIDTLVANKLGYKKSELNKPFVSRIINPTRLNAYHLNGWANIWRAIDYEYIAKKPGKGYTERTSEETFDLLKPNLQDAMEKWAVERKDISEELRVFGTPRSKQVYRNSFFKDKKVSILHCKIFKLALDDDYFFKKLYGVEKELASGKTIADIKSEVDAEVKELEDKLKKFKAKP